MPERFEVVSVEGGESRLVRRQIDSLASRKRWPSFAISAA